MVPPGTALDVLAEPRLQPERHRPQQACDLDAHPPLPYRAQARLPGTPRHCVSITGYCQFLIALNQRAGPHVGTGMTSVGTPKTRTPKRAAPGRWLRFGLRLAGAGLL